MGRYILVIVAGGVGLIAAVVLVLLGETDGGESRKEIVSAM